MKYRVIDIEPDMEGGFHLPDRYSFVAFVKWVPSVTERDGYETDPRITLLVSEGEK